MEISEIPDFYKNKKVFITGHSGFKGSWLAKSLDIFGAIVFGYSLKPNNELNHYDIIQFNKAGVFSDISDLKNLSTTLNDFRPDIVFHLAAQPLVIQSYLDPLETYKTNVIGTANLLESMKNIDSIKSVIIITTDKVYKNIEKETFYSENCTLGGYDIYSSSKACCEILTESYRNSFYNLDKYGIDHSLLIATARAGNVIGGGDWSKNRLIPDLINSAINGKHVEIRSPKSIRPWQHVLDCISGYLLLGANLYNSKKEFSGAWNFSPNKEEVFDVKTISDLSKKSWDDIKFKMHFSPNKFHEANLLMLDNKKAKSLLGWTPKWNTEESVIRTVEWYKDFYITKKINTETNILEYFNLKNEF
jgi:CDP-glucose 4,6-dehydratase